MNSAAVGVIGTLLGVVVGGALQEFREWRKRRWNKEDLLSDHKRIAYAQYVRSISASFAEAEAGVLAPREHGNLRAATAEIQILSAKAVSGPVSELTETVVKTHEELAKAASLSQTEKEKILAKIEDVNRARLAVIELFKGDLAVNSAGHSDRRHRDP
ncbi:hypothetical protein [Paractinoplanes globisporus]|uniref:Uncharacterized protein n=1 Tax=Paractinoplanes globisporus TaxID=113565 RepID=A0ABW6W6H8_9ACTN|nr:hypothetical protein [Actinoplanes globisporus]